MMVVDPEKLVEPFAKAGADNITFHIEATNDPVSVIDLIRSCGSKVGVSIKPATPLSDIFPILDKVDVVLVMSVEPGFGGQGYLPGANERISEIRKYLNEKCLDRVLIEVDGGIKLHNAKEVIDAGANVLVAGSEIFKANNPIQTIKDFYQLTE
jgi:ribulose-phosphate 3-epimerase